MQANAATMLSMVFDTKRVVRPRWISHGRMQPARVDTPQPCPSLPRPGPSGQTEFSGQKDDECDPDC
jgi:hypothetical protein